MLKCGRTILKWKEPKIIQKYNNKQLTIFKRLIQNHSIPFISGFLLFFVTILIEMGIPESFSELMFIAFTSFAIGVLFMVIYGLLSITSPRIVLKESCIIRQHIEDVKRYQYSDFLNYDFFENILESQPFRLLVIKQFNNKVIFFEIPDKISNMDIDIALQGKIHKSKINFDLV